MPKIVAPATAVDVQPDLEEALDEVEVTQLKRRSMMGVVTYMARSVFLQLLGVGTFGLLAAFLSTVDIGIFSIVTQILGLLTLFTDIGFGATLIQKKDRPTIVEYRTVFTVQLLLSFLILVLCGVLAYVDFLGDSAGAAGNWLLMAFGASFVLSTLRTIPAIMLERELRFSKLVLPQIAEQITYAVLVVLLAWKGYGVTSYTIAILARSLMGVLVMYLIQRWPVGLHIDFRSLRGLLGNGVKFQLNSVIAAVKDNLLNIIMGRFVVGLSDYGYVGLAKGYSQMPYQLTAQNLMAVTFPTYSRLQHNPHLLKRAIEKTLFFVTLAIFPLLVGMSTLIGPLMHVVPQYEKWLPALPTFIFFTLSIGPAAISTPLMNTLSALGHLNEQLKLMIMWTILTWVLSPVLFHFIGFNGVALANLLISVTSFIPILMVKKHVDFIFFDQVWRQCIAAVLMGIVGYIGQAWWSQSFIWLLTGGVAISAIYIVVVVSLGWTKLNTEIRSLISKA